MRFWQVVVLRSGRTGERDRLLRVSLAAKGQHQARWRSMRVCSADHQRFTGSEAEWSDRSFQARAYFDTVNPDMADHLDAVETKSERVILLSFSERWQRTHGICSMHEPTLLQGPLLF